MKKLIYCLGISLCPYGSARAQQPAVTGTILNGQGQPIAGATIAVKGSVQATASNTRGRFLLQGLSTQAVLVVTSLGYETLEEPLKGRQAIEIHLRETSTELDEAVINGYGTTTRRLGTGSIGRVTAQEISRMPVSNPLAALQGRVPGLVITPTNGLPGSTFNVLIRGRGSLYSGTQPLYIVDGVPFMQNRNNSQLNTAMVASPLNSINPADIASIEVLKDADATAIYGSQGANGVILVTTKKAGGGSTRLSLDYYAGLGRVTRSAAPMGTAAYLAMRRTAFDNDGITPTPSNAPDLLLWDTTAETDWGQFLIGGTAHIQNLQASISGGNAGTRFLVSGNYNGQTTVFPGSKPVGRTAVYANLSHSAPNNRFRLQLNTMYSLFSINGPVTDLGAAVYLPPNAPALYDSSGKLNWTGWDGVDNPMAQLERQYRSLTYTLNSNLVMEYNIAGGLWLKLSGGYNQVRQDEQRRSPISSKRPTAAAQGEADWQNSYGKNWIAEPQVNYAAHPWGIQTTITAGLSFQQRRQESFTTSGSQYTDDDLLGNPLAAGQVSINHDISAYRYMAVFGRVALQWNKRFLLNLNGRRDGSSRFGPAARFSNFGAVGGAWIFSEEKFIREQLSCISFGKLRASYGVTGNDQIGDYAFLDAWSSPVSGPYQGSVTLAPEGLYNPYLQWEKTKKLEAAVELGFFKDRVLLTTAWYRHRSGNQLTGYALPAQTGFHSIYANLDALLENRGWEISISSTNIQRAGLNWQTAFNLTIPRSKLLRYPGLETSSSRYEWAVNAPLETVFGYHYAGIDAASGLYRFTDQDKDGQVNVTGDYVPIGNLQQAYYGGLDNIIRYKGWELECFIQFVKQAGKNFEATMPVTPGNLGNQPALLAEAPHQQYTALGGGPAYQAYINYQQSSAILGDASFARLKNLSLSYDLPAKTLEKLKLSRFRLYLQGQNLVTLTQYRGADPETQNLLALPPLRLLVAGIAVSF